MLRAERMMRRGLVAGVLLAAMGGGLWCRAEGAGQPGGIGYKFRVGEQMVYAVTITAEMPSGKETLSGFSVYEVKGVDGGVATLKSHGELDSKTEAKAYSGGGGGGRGGFRGPMGPPAFRGGYSGPNYGMEREVQTDGSGKEIKRSGDVQLPYMLGDLWRLAIEPMAGAEKGTWTTERALDLVQKDGGGGGGRGWGMSPFMREPENKTSRTAKETVTYTVGKVEGDTVAIGKKYEFVTDEKNGDEPALREAGEGAIVFDTKAGLVKGIEEKLKITINDGNVTVKIPVTVSVKLMAKEEGEKALADRKAAWEALAAKARADREAAERPVLLDDAAIVRALADMKSQNEGVRKGGVERLAKAVLVERRQADVCKGLAAVLENEKDHWTIAPAVKALGIWGTKESVPALLKVLDGEDGFSRGDVIALLGKIGDASAAPAVAGWMGDMGLRGQVSAALKAMGSKAEDATLPLLKDHDMWVRSEACKVLGEIGTAKSVAALEALRDKEHGGGEAGKALDAIETRKNAPVKGVGTKAHGA